MPVLTSRATKSCPSCPINESPPCGKIGHVGGGLSPVEVALGATADRGPIAVEPVLVILGIGIVVAIVGARLITVLTAKPTDDAGVTSVPVEGSAS